LRWRTNVAGNSPGLRRFALLRWRAGLIQNAVNLALQLGQSIVLLASDTRSRCLQDACNLPKCVLLYFQAKAQRQAQAQCNGMSGVVEGNLCSWASRPDILSSSSCQQFSRTGKRQARSEAYRQFSQAWKARLKPFAYLPLEDISLSCIGS
jgi:hypothetical protein